MPMLFPQRALIRFNRAAGAVADRWHLLKNLSEAVERFLDSQRPSIREAAQGIDQQLIGPAIGSSGSLTGNDVLSRGQTPTDQSVKPLIPTERRYGLYQRAKELQQQGYSIKTIAAHLGSSRNTVKKYFKQAQFVPRNRKKRSNLLSYESYLRQRWQAGETSVKTLFGEIKTQGYNGQYTLLAILLASYPRPSQESTLPPAQKRLSYSSHRLSRLLSQPAVDWPTADRSFLECLLHSNESIDLVHRLTLRFKWLMQNR